MQSHRGNNPLLNAVALVFIALVIFCLFSCKKQVGTDEKTAIEKQYYKVVDVDLDGTEWPSTIVGGKVQVTTTNGGKYYTGSEPLNWQSWTDHERRNWCNYLTFFYDYFPGYFCKICPETAVCKVTPVHYVSITLTGNILTWETANEANINYFSIRASKDGKTFEEVGKVQPHGDGHYSFTIK